MTRRTANLGTIAQLPAMIKSGHHGICLILQLADKAAAANSEVCIHMRVLVEHKIVKAEYLLKLNLVDVSAIHVIITMGSTHEMTN